MNASLCIIFALELPRERKNTSLVWSEVNHITCIVTNNALKHHRGVDRHYTIVLALFLVICLEEAARQLQIEHVFILQYC